MAKKVQGNHTHSSTTTMRQQQKQQTKKESKVQLAIEQVQASLAKAQSKLAKLQARVEARTSQLHKLEKKLATMSSASPIADGDVPDSSSDHRQKQQKPQVIPLITDVPTMSSPIAENDVTTTYEDSQAVSDPSIQPAEDRHEATLDDATAGENVTTSQESSETPPSIHETSVLEPASGMRMQKHVPMSDLKGLEPGVKTKLESEGITSTQQFLEQTRTKHQRTVLANKVDTTPVAILEWANHADLMRLYGVGEVFSNMLIEAGIHSCRELQHSDPEQLYKTLETINMDKKDGHHIPTLAQVTEWMAEAKTLAETSPV